MNESNEALNNHLPRTFLSGARCVTFRKTAAKSSLRISAKPMNDAIDDCIKTKLGSQAFYIYIYIFWHSSTSLWLVADFVSVAPYTTSLFGDIKPSRPRFLPLVTTQQGQTTAPENPCPTLFEQCVGSFTSRRLWTVMNSIVLVRED